MASRTLIVGLGFVLAACGGQPQSVAATNAASEAPPAGAEPSRAPVPVAAPSAAPEAQEHTVDRTNKTGTNVIGDILVKAGTLDGARITGFELRGRCQTAITTAGGTTMIDWSKVGDWAARIEGDQRLIPVDDGSGVHTIGVPATTQPEPIGDAALRVEGGLGVMADNCQS